MTYIANPVFPFPHNWDKELLESLEWKTDILVGETGKEQRVSRRLTPRRSFEASFLLSGSELQFFENFMAMYGGSVMVIPLWHAVTRLTGDMVVGVSSMSVDTTFNEFTVGDLIVARGVVPSLWEAQSISSIASSSVAFSTSPDMLWPIGTFVYPGVLARVEESTKVTKITDRAGEVTVRFVLEQSTTHPSGWVPTTFAGMPVLETPTDDSDDIEMEHQRLLAMVDNAIGKRKVYDTGARQFKTHTYRRSAAGREALLELRTMLYWLRGKARSIWLPTFMADMTVSAATATGGSNLTVKNAGYVRFAMHTRHRANIRIQLWSGVVYYRTVTAVAVASESEEVLAFAQTWPVGFTPAEVARISYLVNMRLDQESIEINHTTDSAGLFQCLVTWKEVDTPEIVDFTGNGGNNINEWVAPC